jgi:thymidylate synthase (FAD)
LNVRLLAHTPYELLRERFPTLGWRQLLPHLAYTFAVEKISRACSHQLVRHRAASFSQQSQRYITVKRLAERVVTPPTVDDSTFRGLVEKASDAYQTLVDSGVPKEDARYVLPNATETSLLVTMTGSALFHFYGLRLCNRAQWEIRSLADAMLARCRESEPEVFDNAGPYCYMLGRCPEGRFICGEMAEAVERYRPEGLK